MLRFPSEKDAGYELCASFECFSFTGSKTEVRTLIEKRIANIIAHKRGGGTDFLHYLPEKTRTLSLQALISSPKNVFVMTIDNETKNYSHSFGSNDKIFYSFDMKETIPNIIQRYLGCYCALYDVTSCIDDELQRLLWVNIGDVMRFTNEAIINRIFRHFEIKRLWISVSLLIACKSFFCRNRKDSYYILSSGKQITEYTQQNFRVESNSFCYRYIETKKVNGEMVEEIKKMKFLEFLANAPLPMVDGLGYNTSEGPVLFSREDNQCLLNTFRYFPLKNVVIAQYIINKEVRDENSPCDLFSKLCFVVLLNFIYHTFCSRDLRILAQFMLWIFQPLQYPSKSTGIVPIIMGPMGTGKSVVAEIICLFLGTHNGIIMGDEGFIGRGKSNFGDPTICEKIFGCFDDVGGLKKDGLKILATNPKAVTIEVKYQTNRRRIADGFNFCINANDPSELFNDNKEDFVQGTKRRKAVSIGMDFGSSDCRRVLGLETRRICNKVENHFQFVDVVRLLYIWDFEKCNDVICMLGGTNVPAMLFYKEYAQVYEKVDSRYRKPVKELPEKLRGIGQKLSRHTDNFVSYLASLASNGAACIYNALTFDYLVRANGLKGEYIAKVQKPEDKSLLCARYEAMRKWYEDKITDANHLDEFDRLYPKNFDKDVNEIIVPYDFMMASLDVNGCRLIPEKIPPDTRDKDKALVEWRVGE